MCFHERSMPEVHIKLAPVKWGGSYRLLCYCVLLITLKVLIRNAPSPPSGCAFVQIELRGKEIHFTIISRCIYYTVIYTKLPFMTNKADVHVQYPTCCHASLSLFETDPLVDRPFPVKTRHMRTRAVSLRSRSLATGQL